MRLTLTLLLIISAQLFLSADVKAQAQKLACPSLVISCPELIPHPGETITISVSIDGGDPNLNPKYRWEVSAGKITSGQGTPAITVDTTGTGGQTVTASVEVDGLSPECSRSASCSVIYESAPVARKFDEYGDLKWTDEEKRLSYFIISLQEEPGTSAYVIAYGPRRVGQHLARIRKYLVEERGLNPDRIITVNGGHNKKTKVELFIAPVGSTPPTPNPIF